MLLSLCISVISIEVGIDDRLEHIPALAEAAREVQLRGLLVGAHDQVVGAARSGERGEGRGEVGGVGGWVGGGV